METVWKLIAPIAVASDTWFFFFLLSFVCRQLKNSTKKKIRKYDIYDLTAFLIIVFFFFLYSHRTSMKRLNLKSTFVVVVLSIKIENQSLHMNIEQCRVDDVQKHKCFRFVAYTYICILSRAIPSKETDLSRKKKKWFAIKWSKWCGKYVECTNSYR